MKRPQIQALYIASLGAVIVSLFGLNRGSVRAISFLDTHANAKAKATLTTVRDGFGSSVALSNSGRVVLVGAPGKTIGRYPHQGAAYIFTNGAESVQRRIRLIASDGSASNGFGRAVTLNGDGNLALIGAPNKAVNGHTHQGVVYVFSRVGNTWHQTGEFTASDGTVSDGFGSAVVLSKDGHLALIGAPGKAVRGRLSQGVVYVFVQTNGVWHQISELTSSNGAASDRFGSAIAYADAGNLILIGAPYKTIGRNTQQGEAYVFSQTGKDWLETRSLVVKASKYFSTSDLGLGVALDSRGTVALVGSNSFEDSDYVFTRSGAHWYQTSTIFPPGNGKSGTGSGATGSVSLSANGTTALVGGVNATGGGNQYYWDAAVFMHTNGAWDQTAQSLYEFATAADNSIPNDFGVCVALSGDGQVALIGAPNESADSAIAPGKVYIYSVSSEIETIVTAW